MASTSRAWLDRAFKVAARVCGAGFVPGRLRARERGFRLVEQLLVHAFRELAHLPEIREPPADACQQVRQARRDTRPFSVQVGNVLFLRGGGVIRQGFRRCGQVLDRRDGIGVALFVECRARGVEFRLRLGVTLGQVLPGILVDGVERVLRGVDRLAGRVFLRTGGEREDSRERRDQGPDVHGRRLRTT